MDRQITEACRGPGLHFGLAAALPMRSHDLSVEATIYDTAEPGIRGGYIASCTLQT